MISKMVKTMMMDLTAAMQILKKSALVMSNELRRMF